MIPEHRTPLAPIPPNAARDDRPFAAVLWMVAAQACFACMSLGGRLLAGRVAWPQVALVRFVIGALAAYLVARIRLQRLVIRHRSAQFWRSVFGTLAAMGTFYLLSRAEMALGDAVTLFATSPLFVALISLPLLGERVTKSTLAAALFGFLGVILIARPSMSSAPWLVAIGIGTAASTAIAMVWLRRMGPDESSEAIVFYFSLFGAVPLLGLAYRQWKDPTAAEWLLLVTTAFAGGFGQIFMTRAYSLTSAARVSAVMSTGVVMTRFAAMGILGERADGLQWLGTAIIVIATTLVAARSRTLQRHPPPKS